VVLRIGAVIWAIAGFRLVTDPLTTRGRSERVLSEGYLANGNEGPQALIAWIRGPMPMMFITRVRL
jgi:hypothetical protein